MCEDCLPAAIPQSARSIDLSVSRLDGGSRIRAMRWVLGLRPHQEWDMKRELLGLYAGSNRLPPLESWISGFGVFGLCRTFRVFKEGRRWGGQ